VIEPNEFRELREMFIRMEANINNLNTRFDGFISQSNSTLQRYDEQLKSFEERLRAIEKNVWMGMGAIAIGSWLINYFS
jgi:DNA repair exonuclease SbcCD ATPase subunit